MTRTLPCPPEARLPKARLPKVLGRSAPVPLALLPLALLPLAACGGDDEGEAASGPALLFGTEPPPVVATTFLPTTYLAERIGADAVQVVCPVPRDADPAHWQPSREAIAAFQEAELVLLAGAGLERWTDTASLPPSRVVDVSAGLEEHLLAREGTVHAHGAAGEHSHAGVDPHVWLDPVLAKEQAVAVRDALLRLVPAERAEGVRARAQGVLDELDELDAAWRALAPRLAEARLVAAHPAYDYLARRYGFGVQSLDLDPAAPLDADALEEVRAACGDAPRCLVLWESEPGEETRAALDELGIGTVVVDPAEVHDPGSGIYPQRLRDNVERLRAALE